MTSPRQLAQGLSAEIRGKRFVDFPVQWGKVAAVNTNPASVDMYLDGSATVTPKIRYLSSYTPAVGDVCPVLRWGSDRVALGIPAK